MIAKILIMVSIILTISCKKEEKVGPSVNDIPAFNYSYNVYGSNTGKRVFMIHGLSGSRADFNSGNLKELRDRTVANGNQVITFDTPYTRAYYFNDGGTKYRKMFKDFLDWIIADTNSKLGNASDLIIGGYSFGGYHAFMAVASTNYFNGYFGLLPLTRMASLGGFTQVNVPNFDPFSEIARLQTVPGFINWGTSDSVVDYTQSIRLVDLVGNTLEWGEHVGSGHGPNMAEVQEVVDWIN